MSERRRKKKGTRESQLCSVAHCHSFNKPSRKEYINKNWLEFYRSEHESYVSNSWILVVRESFIFIWNFDPMVLIWCHVLFPFSLFPFPFFTSCLDDIPFLVIRFVIGSSAYFQLKWCSSNDVDDCKMKRTIQTRKFAIFVGQNCNWTAEWWKDPTKFIYFKNVEKNFDYRTMNEKIFNMLFRISSKCN